MVLRSNEAILRARLLILALSIAIGSIWCCVEGGVQREFDYFNLAVQWPGTLCQRSGHCCRGSNIPAEFTIHGLWPDYNDGTWPACCTDSRFNPREISSLHDALDKYWPSLRCDALSSCQGGEGSFWGHEMVINPRPKKHGTCSSPVVQDEYSYFVMTMNLYFKYNVTKVLNEAGYVPSNTEKYSLEGIVSAIENAFHTTPKLVCSEGAVEELYLCFRKDFKTRECVYGSSNEQSSCPSYVSLPAYVSSGLENVKDAVSRDIGSEAI